jgi:hypothetical protein
MQNKGELQRTAGFLLAALLLAACGGAEVVPSATALGSVPSLQPTVAPTAIPPASLSVEVPPAPAVAAHASPVSPLPTSLAAARTPCDAGACVLFLGNSFTFANDLPQIFAALAASGGHDVEVGISAQGGWTLADHASSPMTLNMLEGKAWDYVVLQEQSLIPAVAAQRQARMLPAASQLEAGIRAAGAEPLLFLTWARRDGLPSAGFGDYGQMQAAIELGYLTVAEELQAAVAPVGTAWQQAAGQEPPIELWQVDGLHPTKAGSYLAACVFYAAIMGESPRGLPYTAGLSQDTAQTLQVIAAEIVFQDPARRSLP